MSEKVSEQHTLNDMLYLMRRLRDPDTGCPWDLKQSYRSITSSTIEEAYEVVDAIEHEDYEHLREELGDLLFQVIFYSQLADEEGRFSFHDVVHALTAKLVRRHPHVFPDGTLKSKRSSDEVLDDAGIKASWERIKQDERDLKGSDGVFDDVPSSLPSLMRAAKLQKRAAKQGFDWQRADEVLDKIEEELTELCEAFESQNMDQVAGELGDLMFSCVNLARHIGRDPDSLVRQANQKFESRFNHVAQRMQEGAQKAFSSEELEGFWREAKALEG